MTDEPTFDELLEALTDVHLQPSQRWLSEAIKSSVKRILELEDEGTEITDPYLVFLKLRLTIFSLHLDLLPIIELNRSTLPNDAARRRPGN